MERIARTGEEMKEKIFRAGSDDYYFDIETRKWYCGDKEKSTSFIGSYRSPMLNIPRWGDIDLESVTFSKTKQRGFFPMIISGAGQEYFTPNLVDGNYALGVKEILEIDEGKLVFGEQYFSCCIVGPIEKIYSKRRLEKLK